MSKEKALQNFRKPPLSLNCAQTIAHAFGREDLISKMQTCGSGNAPDGLCGALFCALQIVDEKDASNLLETFEKKLGYRTCSQLKKEGRVPCPDCVACVAEILESKA